MAAVTVSLPEMTFSGLVERYRHYALNVRNANAEMIRKRRIYLERMFEFLGRPPGAAALFARLDPKTITAFLGDYAPQHGAGSRRDMHTTLRAFLHFAYEEQFTPQDLSFLVPCVRQHAVDRLPKALPEAVIAALEETIERFSPRGRRDAAIVCLLDTYGVRGGQIRSLRLEHIDWERERIRFPACKGGRPIEQHLTAKAGNRLAAYIAGGRPPSSYREVFLVQATATPLRASQTLSNIIRRRLRRAGAHVPTGVSRGTHGFRHAFATRLVGRVPFKDLADMLGHRSLSSTLVYSKVDVQTLQQAALPWPGGLA
jgi:integrase